MLVAEPNLRDVTGPNCGRSDDNVQAYHYASRYEARSSEIKPADGTFGAQETLLPLLEISRRRKRGQNSIAMTSRHAPRISIGALLRSPLPVYRGKRFVEIDGSVGRMPVHLSPITAQ